MQLERARTHRRAAALIALIAILSISTVAVLLAGNTPDVFYSAFALAAAPDGKVLVADADQGDNGVRVFSADGRYLHTITGPLRDPGVQGLAVALSGDIYAVIHDRVLVLSPSGTLLRTVGAGRLRDARGLSLSPSGELYVVDQSRCDVAVFDASGRPSGRIGRCGAEPGDLRKPFAVAVAGRTVFVSDTGQNAVLVFDTSGRWLRTITVGGLALPQGIAATPAEAVIVAAAHRMFVLSRRGSVLLTIGAAHYIQPVQVAVGPDGTIYETGSSEAEAFSRDGRYLGRLGRGPFTRRRAPLPAPLGG